MKKFFTILTICLSINISASTSALPIIVKNRQNITNFYELKIYRFLQKYQKAKENKNSRLSKYYQVKLKTLFRELGMLELTTNVSTEILK
jgi:hypothetical protein